MIYVYKCSKPGCNSRLETDIGDSEHRCFKCSSLMSLHEKAGGRVISFTDAPVAEPQAKTKPSQQKADISSEGAAQSELIKSIMIGGDDKWHHGQEDPI